MNELKKWYREQDKLTRAIIISAVIVLGITLLLILFSNRYTGIATFLIASFMFLVFMVYTSLDDL